MLFNKNSTTPTKSRVRGDGPDRHQLPAYLKLLKLPDSINQKLVLYFETHKDQNALTDTTHYRIAEHCPLLEVTPKGMRHLLLTQVRKNGDPLDERDYLQWIPDENLSEVKSWFDQHLPNAFRVRLSYLEPESLFDWHIDTNTSVSCRCSVQIFGDETTNTFEIKKRHQLSTVPLTTNDIYFTNTGWPHRVYNNGKTARLNLVFGINYRDIQKYFPDDLIV